MPLQVSPATSGALMSTVPPVSLMLPVLAGSASLLITMVHASQASFEPVVFIVRSPPLTMYVPLPSFTWPDTVRPAALPPGPTLVTQMMSDEFVSARCRSSVPPLIVMFLVHFVGVAVEAVDEGSCL